MNDREDINKSPKIIKKTIKDDSQYNHNTGERKKSRKKSIKSHKTEEITKKTDKKSYKYITIAGLSAIALLVGGYYYYNSSSSDEPLNFNINTKSSVNSTSNDGEVVSESINISISNNGSDDIYDWSKENKAKLRDSILKYSVSPIFFKAANDNSIPNDMLMASKDPNSYLMSEKDIYISQTGYPMAKTTGAILSNQGTVTDILPDSSAYVYGIRLGWKLLNVGGIIAGNFPEQSKLDQLLSTKQSSWMNPQGKIISFKQIPLYPATGAIAEAWMQKGLLVIRINHLTNTTPGRIYQLMQKYITSTNRPIGVILDLRAKGGSISGLSELTWLLNGQQNTLIANLSDRNNKQYNIVANKPGFQINPNILKAFNSLKSIIVVNENTEGTTELLANNIKKSKANVQILGSATKGATMLPTYFAYDIQSGIALSTYHIISPQKVNIEGTFPQSMLNSLYLLKRN